MSASHSPGHTRRSLRPLPALIFMSRWLQVPLYLGLIVAQAVYVFLFLKEVWHLLSHATSLDEISVMLAVLVCAYTFVFKKTNEKRQALVADIESKQKVLNNLSQATAGIDDLNRKTQELEKAIKFFQSKLPQEREVDKILQDVWQMAAANSLESKTVKMQKTEKTANYSEQPIQMSLSGDFNGFYSFLLQLEKLPRITRVTQMKLEKISDREGAMQAQLTLSIFFDPGTPAVASTSN